MKDVSLRRFEYLKFPAVGKLEDLMLYRVHTAKRHGNYKEPYILTHSSYNTVPRLAESSRRPRPVMRSHNRVGSWKGSRGRDM